MQSDQVPYLTQSAPFQESATVPRGHSFCHVYLLAGSILERLGNAQRRVPESGNPPLKGTGTTEGESWDQQESGGVSPRPHGLPLRCNQDNWLMLDN